MNRICIAAAAVLIVFASLHSASAQGKLDSDDIVDSLRGLEQQAQINAPALYQRALARIKAEPGMSAVNRPSVAEELNKLPQLTVEIQFNLDSDIIRPVSYKTLGRIADALYHPYLARLQIPRRRSHRRQRQARIQSETQPAPGQRGPRSLDHDVPHFARAGGGGRPWRGAIAGCGAAHSSGEPPRAVARDREGEVTQILRAAVFHRSRNKPIPFSIAWLVFDHSLRLGFRSREATS